MAEIKHGHPDAIRHFAHMLRHFCQETNDGLHALQAHLSNMAPTEWDDYNHRNYIREFEDVLRRLHQSLDTFSDDQSSRLENLARQYEDVNY